MSGLHLGDIVLDSRGFVYIPTIKTIVCSGLQVTLASINPKASMQVVRNLDSGISDYTPERVLNIGPMNHFKALDTIAKRWGSKTCLTFIARKSNDDARHKAEHLGFEVHKELVWDKFRFVENEDLSKVGKKVDPQIPMNVLTITGGKHYGVHFGNQVFGGKRLPAYLKGFGYLLLPQLDLHEAVVSIFQKGLSRFDVFAIGHTRVLPLGKVVQVRARKRLGQGVPLLRSTFEPEPVMLNSQREYLT